MEHSTQLSGAWLTTIPRAYFSLLGKPAIDAGIRSRLLMPVIQCAAPRAAECCVFMRLACGSGVRIGTRALRETVPVAHYGSAETTGVRWTTMKGRCLKRR